MLPLNNSLTHDGPISDHISQDNLHQWYAQMTLILTNLLAIPAIIYLYRLGYGVGGTILLFASLVSYFYHQCQTTSFCPVFDLREWTMIDHITATLVLAYQFLFTIAPVYSEELYEMNSLEGRRKRRTYFQDYLVSRENTFHDSWGSSMAVFYFFTVVISTIAYPFSSQNYVITIAFGLAIVFLQIVVINESNLDLTKKRLSIPDLIFALVLFIGAVILFIVDSWFYWLPHSLWHALVNIALLFYAMALTKAHPLHYSLASRIICYH